MRSVISLSVRANMLALNSFVFTTELESDNSYSNAHLCAIFILKVELVQGPNELDIDNIKICQKFDVKSRLTDNFRPLSRGSPFRVLLGEQRPGPMGCERHFVYH